MGIVYDPGLVRAQIEVELVLISGQGLDKNDRRVGSSGSSTVLMARSPRRSVSSSSSGRCGSRRFVGLVELWVYVPPGKGSSRYEAELRKYGLWAFHSMKADIYKDPDYHYPFELLTGFQHRGKHFKAMFPDLASLGGRLIGMLFVIR